MKTKNEMEELRRKVQEISEQQNMQKKLVHVKYVAVEFAYAAVRKSPELFFSVLPFHFLFSFFVLSLAFANIHCNNVRNYRGRSAKTSAVQ
jgi:hypothetical protein